jgi:hypothetical protein
VSDAALIGAGTISPRSIRADHAQRSNDSGGQRAVAAEHLGFDSREQLLEDRHARKPGSKAHLVRVGEVEAGDMKGDEP